MPGASSLACLGILSDLPALMLLRESVAYFVNIVNYVP